MIPDGLSEWSLITPDLPFLHDSPNRALPVKAAETVSAPRIRPCSSCPMLIGIVTSMAIGMPPTTNTGGA